MWSLNPEIGSISADGLYTAPSVIRSSQHVRVTAATQTSRTQSGSAEISLERGSVASNLTVVPAGATLGAGETQKFSASMNGPEGSAATWSLDPNVGVISADGTYMAPSPIHDEQTVSILAVGGLGATAHGTAAVTLKPLSISVSPKSAVTYSSNRVSLKATVTWSSNPGVHWGLNGPGYVSPNGVYFAPPQITAERTVMVTANSIVDPTKSASVPIVLMPTVSVSILPLTAKLGASGKVQFFAAVSGATNVAVKWALTGPGTLGNDGSYTAPASIISAQNVQITATSVVQPSKSAIATISLVPLTVEITPASAVLRASESQSFRAIVKGGETRLIWRLTGPGQLASNGVYTAPSYIRRDETAQLTVYSSSDPSRQATAVLQLLAYHGPMNGTIFWSGRVPQDGDFYITGNSVSVGAVKGQELPRVPVQIWLNNKDFTVGEMPGPSNGFRLKMHSSRRGRDSTVSIGWTVNSNEPAK